MKNEKGISLIVLVITIIVMVILAGAVIITLENTDLIKHSKQATNKTNYSQEITRLEVLKNGILTDNLGKITLEEYVAELTNKGMIEGTPVDNADGSKTVKMTSGAEVKLTQDGPRNILIEIAGYTEGNNDNTTPKPTKLTFTMGEIEFEFSKNMTWGEWITSEYTKNINFIYDEEFEFIYVGPVEGNEESLLPLGAVITDMAGTPVNYNDLIIENTTYNI